jgi:dynein heavy chain
MLAKCSLLESTVAELTSRDRSQLLQVQRNWMYLENIFIGSEDIRKQLPQESLMFEGVHHAFMRSMAWLHSVANVVQATTGQGLLAAFQVGAEPTTRQQKTAAADAYVS